MRKLLLSGFAMFTSVYLIAQSGAVTNLRPVSKINYVTAEQKALTRTTPSTTTLHPTIAHSSSSRAVSTILLGSAGNAYGSINSSMNQVSFNSSTNQIIFIHRTNNKLFVADDANNGQYRYDISRDGGATWTVNHGLLNPSGTQAGFACRFPNATMYNPTGNTDPDSSYLTYFGSFHNGATTSADWQGYCTGRARLDNAPSTYTERRYTPNSSNTSTAGNLIQSTPGVFWAVDEYITSVDGTNPTGISVYKGTWNADTNGVVWTAPIVLNPPLDATIDGNKHLVASSIAFDPTGQYGWIAAAADVISDLEGTFDPIFYKSIDFGATWSPVISLDLDSISGITYDPALGPASTTFELGLAVDVNGNPHLGLVVLPSGTGTAYSVASGAPDKYIYDVTYDPTLSADCQWRAINLDYVNSFRKDIGDASCDNYIKASRTEDGTKIFFSWVDSDSSTVLPNGPNDLPNFKMIGLDILNNKRTLPKNFTIGDAAWDGEVLWPQTSPIVRNVAGTYNIPTVFAKLNAALSDLDTTYFHYVSNINFTNAEFSLQLDNTPPDLTLVGPNPDWIAVGSPPYSDPGATATDCYDGNLNDSIKVVSTVVESTAGVYTITYTVRDAAGNVSTTTRTVRVATAPDCSFTITPSTTIGGRVNLQYTNPGGGALSWSWRFGNGGGVSGITNGNVPFTYTQNGTYTVVFCATNPIGTCCDSQTITIGNVSVQNINLNDNVSVYPNPASDLLNVSIDISNTANATIKLTNIVGSEVYTKNLGTINGTINEKINVADLESGIYILRLQTENGTATKKINIVRK